MNEIINFLENKNCIILLPNNLMTVAARNKNENTPIMTDANITSD